MPIFKNVNKDFFKVWTPNMAYVLGFFAADGYMTLNKRGAYFWSIQITDKELLEEIKQSLGSNHKINVRARHGNEKTLFRLQVGSKEMCTDLRNLGFTEAKTMNMSVPNIPSIYFRDFVRGYFDGDGHVWTGYIHNSRKTKLYTMQTGFTSCSGMFLGEIRRRLRLFGVIGASLWKGEGNCYRLSYGKRASLKLYDLMYNHPVLVSGKDIFLKRKKIVFDRYLAMRP